MLRKSTNWGVKCRTTAQTLEGSFGKWTIPTFGDSAATPATPLQNLLCLPASQKIEETLWTSLRTFEERKNLLNIMAATSPEKGKSRIAQRARETQIPIERIKAMVQASQQKSGRRTLAHVDELMAQPGMAASAQTILRWTMAAPFRCGVWKHSSTVPFPWQIGHTFARRTVPIPRHVGHRSFWIPQDRLRKDRPEQASVWRRLSQIYVWNLPKRPSEQN